MLINYSSFQPNGPALGLIYRPMTNDTNDVIGKIVLGYPIEA